MVSAFEYRNTTAYDFELSGTCVAGDPHEQKRLAQHGTAARLDSSATDIPADVLGGWSAANRLSCKREHRHKQQHGIEHQHQHRRH